MFRRSIRRFKTRPITQERDADSSSDVCVRAVTSDRIEANIQTSLTISTLILGIAVSLLLAANTDDVVFFREQGGGTTNGKELFYRATVFSFLAWMSAGVDFFISTILWIFLSMAELHPEDYDSAEDWQRKFKPVINLCKGIEIIAIAWLNIAAIQIAWLRTKHSLDTLITFIYFFPTLGGLALIPVIYFKCYVPAREVLAVRRAKEIQPAHQMIPSLCESTIQSVLNEIDPTFADKYSQVFLTAEIKVAQLPKLHVDWLTDKLSVPLGHAIEMREKFVLLAAVKPHEEENEQRQPTRPIPKFN